MVYDHPFSWKAEDLSPILARLFLEERVGFMDHAKPAKSIFSSEEIALIQSAVRQAIQDAGPEEWIAFLLLQPHGVETGVTSGALFIEAHKLHVVIANHRTVVSVDSAELTRVRANPLYSIQGSGGVVGFEPSRFGVGTKANWSGGHRASASELIIDHAAFLTYLTHAMSLETNIRALAPSRAQNSAESQKTSDDTPGQGARHDSTTLGRLQADLERLKQQLAEKDQEIDRLKSELLRSHPKP